VTLPERIDTSAMLKRAVEEAHVAYVPGSAFFARGGGRHFLRLSFSVTDEATIADGISRLAALIRSELAS